MQNVLGSRWGHSATFGKPRALVPVVVHHSLKKAPPRIDDPACFVYNSHLTRPIKFAVQWACVEGPRRRTNQPEKQSFAAFKDLNETISLVWQTCPAPTRAATVRALSLWLELLALSSASRALHCLHLCRDRGTSTCKIHSS